MSVNPGRLLILLEPGDEGVEVRTAAAAEGFDSVVCNSPEDVLLQTQQDWPDAVLLPLGRREEDTVLLSRALRRRAEQKEGTLTILLVVRGGSLVESTDEARDAGADHLIPNMAPADLLARARELMTGEEVSGDALVDEDPIIVVAEGFEEDDADSLAEGLMGESVIESTPVSLAEVRLKLDEVRYADYFVILGVARDASTETIATAVLTLKRQYDPGRARDARLKDVLAEIVGGVEDAWMVLGDRRLRRRYRQNLPRVG